MKASNEISYIAHKRNKMTPDHKDESNYSRLSLRKKKINSFIDNYKEKDYQKQFEERKFTNEAADELIIPEIYVQKENNISSKEDFIEYISDLINTKDALLIKYTITVLKKNFLLKAFDVFDEKLLGKSDFINLFFGVLREYCSDYYVLTEGFHILNHFLESLKAEFLNEYADLLLMHEYDIFVLNSGNLNTDILVLMLENLKILYSKKLKILMNTNSEFNFTQKNEVLIGRIYSINETFYNDSSIQKISLELTLEVIKFVIEQKPVGATDKYYVLSQNSILKIQNLMILIHNNCLDENFIYSITNLILFLTQNGYYEENSVELQALLDSNFLITFILKTEQKIELIKLVYAEKNILMEFTSQDSLVNYLQILQNLSNSKEMQASEQLKQNIISLIQSLYELPELAEQVEKEMVILLSKFVLIDRKFITLLIDKKQASNLLKKNFISKYNRNLRIEYIYFFRNLFYNCTFNLASKIINNDFLSHFIHLMKNVQDPIFIHIYLDALGFLFNIDIRVHSKNSEMNILNPKNYHENFVEHFPVKINRNPFRKIFANMDGMELLESMQLKYTGEILKKINNILEILELENDPRN